MAQRPARRMLVLAFLGVAMTATSSGLITPAYLNYQVKEEKTCLPQEAIPFANRSLITIDGQTMPVKIWQLSWPSAYVMAVLVKIILEEKLGFHTVIVGNVGASSSAYTALADCEEPFPFGKPCVPAPRGSRGHLAFEVWSNYDISVMNKVNSEGWMARFPERVGFPGGLGFDGVEGIYVGKSSIDDAWNNQKLPLQWYQSYNSTVFDPSVFFDRVSDLPVPNEGCDSLGALNMVGSLKTYMKATKDPIPTETVDGSTFTKCYNNWVPSAKCREAGNVDCIPLITTGGYTMADMMQWSFWYDMKVMLGSYTWGEYEKVGLSKRTLFYWYMPDVTMLPIGPAQVRFPPTNIDEINQGIVKTMIADRKIWKLMSNVIPEAASLVGLFMNNFEISMGSIMTIVANFTFADPFYSACQFIRDYPERWNRWVPDRTQCVLGQGLMKDDAGQLACSFCPAGRRSVPHPNMTQARLCEDCKPGRFQSLSGQKDCDLCAPGFFSPAQGADECLFCPVGRFSEMAGKSICDACAADKTTQEIASSNSSKCVCKEGSYLAIGASRCTMCTKSLECPTGSNSLFIPTSPGAPILGPFPKPAVGFYATYDQPLSIYRCLDEAACPGEMPENCALNTKGLACGSCLLEHFKVDKGCRECSDVHKSKMLFPTLPVLMLPILVWVLQLKSRDDIDKFEGPMNSISVMLYVALQYVQTLGVLSSSEVKLAGSAATLTDATTIFVDLLSLLRPECAALPNFMEMYVNKLLIPVFICIVFLLTYIVCWPIKRIRMDRDVTMSVYGVFFNTFYISIAAEAVNVFQCYPHPNGKSSLRRAPAVLCYEGEWGSAAGLGVVAILVFCIGSLVLFGWAIYMAPRRIAEKSFRMRWKFLLVRYRPRVYWWSIALLLKGLWINMASVFTTIEVQLGWMVIGLTTYTVMVVLIMPWRVYKCCYADLISNAALVYIFGLAGLFVRVNGEGEGSLSTFLSVCMLLPLVVYFLFALYFLKQKVMPSPAAANTGITRTTLGNLTIDEDFFKEWFNELSERDKGTVKRVASLLKDVPSGSSPSPSDVIGSMNRTVNV